MEDERIDFVDNRHDSIDKDLLMMKTLNEHIDDWKTNLALIEFELRSSDDDGGDEEEFITWL